MRNYFYVLLVLMGMLAAGCGETKRLTQSNYYFKYIDNSVSRTRPGRGQKDRLEVYQNDSALHSKIDDKVTYQVIKTKALSRLRLIDTIPYDTTYADKIKLNGVLYTNESDLPGAEKYQRGLRYWDTKFTVAPLTVPLKFRGKIGDGSVYPAQLETGVNIGIAPAIKKTYNVFNPQTKVFGNSLNQYSFSLGPMINMGGTDLKAASNAPGLKLDRKAATLSYGLAFVFGVNKISLGYAIGKDKVLGEGKSYWVYQDKIWHGILFSVSL